MSLTCADIYVESPYAAESLHFLHSRELCKVVWLHPYQEVGELQKSRGNRYRQGIYTLKGLHSMRQV